jgi:hypothetical protein
MRSHARRPAAPGRRAGRLALAALLLASGCRPGPLPLPIETVVPLPPEAAGAVTLAVALDGALWLGAPGAVAVLREAAPAVRLPISGSAAPRLLGVAGGRALLATADSLFLLDAGTGALLGSTAALGPALLDVRGRWVFMGARSGAVMIHETDSLRTISAWPSLDRAATAIAASPEGDRIYLALAEAEGGTILTRDLQTGRTLRTDAFAAPIRGLAVDVEGRLLALLAEGETAEALLLRPWGPRLELLWRDRGRGDPALAAVRLDPAGARSALILPGANGNGLRALDAETGRLIGSLEEPPLDAAFDSAGRLLLLYPGELRIVR